METDTIDNVALMEMYDDYCKICEQTVICMPAMRRRTKQCPVWNFLAYTERRG